MFQLNPSVTNYSLPLKVGKEIVSLNMNRIFKLKFKNYFYFFFMKTEELTYCTGASNLKVYDVTLGHRQVCPYRE